MSLRAELDLEALADNVALLRRLAGPERTFIGSIKANAYGHGAVAIAKALQSLGVESLATGSPADVTAMRAAGVALPILLLACAPPKQTAELAANGYLTTVNNHETAAAISASVTTSTGVYIKVDAGLGRLGIPMSEALAVIERIARLPNLRIDGMYTHAPFKGHDSEAWSQRCLNQFGDLANQLAALGVNIPVIQAGASATVLAGLHDTGNAVCIGHAMFGLSPFAMNEKTDEFAEIESLKPVLQRVSTSLVSVTDHGQGADIMIAGMTQIPNGKRIGVLPVGVGHGLARPDRQANAQVLVNGKRAPVLAVSLEHTTIDLDYIDATLGDEVVILGISGNDQLTLQDSANWNGRTPLQTLMDWSGRVELN
ncbi:MAG: alanine racemase [Chromatiales bacterium]|jgi:alanine racemase|nr:alanine racemase [Chromatiales bacterium]